MYLWWRTRPFCFTSTEARLLITDGDGGGGGVGGGGKRCERVRRGRESEGSTADTARKRPERPWSAARTMEVLRQCPHRHCAATSAPRSCCFNCRAGQSHKGQCPLHCCWGTTRSERSPTFAAQLHLPAHDLFWLTWGYQPPPTLSWSRLEPLFLYACQARGDRKRLGSLCRVCVTYFER